MLRPEILSYYALGGEQTRLAAGPGRLEYLRTRDVLARVLPGPPASVLDVGGATGVYAEPLAADGYRVHLVDPVPGHVAEAISRPGVTAELGDARALPAGDATVDAVLLLGPLYHLLDRADRVAAWREAGRVVRPGGVVVGATISRYGSLLAGFWDGSADEPRFRALVDGALADGVHRSREPGGRWFTSAYLHHPGEPAAEATEAGLDDARTVLVEGPVWLVGRLDGILADPAATAHLLDRLREVEAEPSLLGATSHLLTIVRRR
jgi:SAM-dependent methyltransferase